MEMHCKGLRILPILHLVIPLVTTLRLRNDSDGNPLIAVSAGVITLLGKHVGEQRPHFGLCFQDHTLELEEH